MVYVWVNEVFKTEWSSYNENKYCNLFHLFRPSKIVWPDFLSKLLWHDVWLFLSIVVRKMTSQSFKLKLTKVFIGIGYFWFFNAWLVPLPQIERYLRSWNCTWKPTGLTYFENFKSKNKNCGIRSRKFRGTCFMVTGHLHCKLITKTY